MSDFNISMIVGALAFLGTLAIIIREDGAPDDAREFLLYVFVVSVAGISAQMLTYVGLDTFKRSETMGLVEFIKEDMSSGRFSLRIVTFLIGVKAASNIVSLIYQIITHNDDFLPKNTFHYDDVNKLSNHVDENSLNLINLSQYGIYLSAMLILWHTTENQDLFIYVSLLSWALLFIVDDWIVIYQTIEALRGRVLRQHFIKILTFNILLLVGVAYIAFSELGIINVIASMICLASMIAHYYLIYDEKLLKNKSA